MMILNHLTLTLCSEDTSEGSVGQGVLKMDSINKRADLSDELQWEVSAMFGLRYARN